MLIIFMGMCRLTNIFHKNFLNFFHYISQYAYSKFHSSFLLKMVLVFHFSIGICLSLCFYLCCVDFKDSPRLKWIQNISHAIVLQGLLVFSAVSYFNLHFFHTSPLLLGTLLLHVVIVNFSCFITFVFLPSFFMFLINCSFSEFTNFLYLNTRYI